MAPKQPSSVVVTQRDFSAGELDVALKRSDDNPIMRAGARQMENWRILNSRGVQNRPGRKALFVASGRTEIVYMQAGQPFFLNFVSGALRVFNQAGTVVFSSTKKGDGATDIPWTANTVGNVVWAGPVDNAIYIAYGDDAPLNVPQILTWDGVSQTSTWTLSTFAESVTGGGQKRTVFYRLSQKGVTMQPSAATGAGITLTFSSGIAVAGMVGTRMRYTGRQLLITGFTNSTHLTATVQEALPPTQTIPVGIDPRTLFNVGDLVQGSQSNAQGIVLSLSATQIVAQLISSSANVITQQNSAHGGAGVSSAPNATAITTIGFINGENIIGPGGSDNITAIPTNGAPGAITVWDEEVMNNFRGWPQSVFFDQGRLGFANFPAISGGIGWSAFGVTADFYVDAPPTAAMFEIVPDKSQVYFVVAGPESGEFVFCDRKVYYIPITVTNPLKPGSVVFNVLSSDGAAKVQPRPVEELIFYAQAGGRRVKAVIAPGAYYRPFNTIDVSEMHDHLFTSGIAAIAAPTSDTTGTVGSSFPERYIYVTIFGGVTAVVGKYTVKNGILEGPVGWLPWSSPNGAVQWVAAFNADVAFSTLYSIPGAAPAALVEFLTDFRKLDGAQLYNTQPTGLPIPGGKGPLYYIAGGTVDLVDGPDQTRMMGTYQIDANGFLIPQGNAGEDFSSANLACGQAWQALLEPFVPAVQAGQDVGQRLWPRRIIRAQVYVINSTGFVMERLYSDQSGPNLPVSGTVMKQRRIPAWNVDDDPTQPPPLREQSYLDRPLGRSHDPRWRVNKDTPGPITVAEISFEVTT